MTGILLSSLPSTRTPGAYARAAPSRSTRPSAPACSLRMGRSGRRNPYASGAAVTSGPAGARSSAGASSWNESTPMAGWLDRRDARGYERRCSSRHGKSRAAECSQTEGGHKGELRHELGDIAFQARVLHPVENGERQRKSDDPERDRLACPAPAGIGRGQPGRAGAAASPASRPRTRRRRRAAQMARGARRRCRRPTGH